MQSRFLKSVKNWSFETKITKIQVFDAHLNGHFTKFQNPKLAFLDKMTYYQQIRIKKWFPKKPLDGISVEFLFRKNPPDAILIFGRHFGFFSNLFFPKKCEYFL
jgi:hypothetical protein